MRWHVVWILGLLACRPAQTTNHDLCEFRTRDGTTGAATISFDEVERNPVAFEGRRVRVRGRLRGIAEFCPAHVFSDPMGFPDEGTWIYECREPTKHAIKIATTRYCDREWVDPWADNRERDPLFYDPISFHCDFGGPAVVGEDEMVGLPTSSLKTIYCDGRMASVTGTIRKGALVRVTAIEPEPE